MKILVLGAIGMAGHMVALYMMRQGHQVTAYSLKPFPYCDNLVGDAFDLKGLEQVLLSDDWDGVINCMGILNQVCDEHKSLAAYINGFIPHYIVDTLKDRKAKFVHISTDSVFSGKDSPYYEDAVRDGTLFYDRSKSLGEIDDERNVTFRTSIVGPDINEDGRGLLNWFMKQTGPLKGFTSAVWTGVSTLTLAKCMEQALTTDAHGIYNLVNNQDITKYDLLQLFNKYFKDGNLKIEPYSGYVMNKSLRHGRKDHIFNVPSYEQMVAELHQWCIDNKDIYPHYKL